MAPVGWKGVKGRPRGRRVRAGAPPPVFSLIGSEISSEALRHRKEITNEKDADCPHCHSSAGHISELDGKCIPDLQPLTFPEFPARACEG
jgi:hypothetical protein